MKPYIHTLKTLLKKYYPLAFVLFMASQGDGCTACNQPPKEEPQLMVELVKSPDIKGDEKGKVILKIKGVKWYNDVWLYFKNHQAFMQEDGKALQSPMELHTFLGKDNGKIPEEGIEVELPLQASEDTIQDNKANTILSMSVGNAVDPTAYVSEQEVLTWRKAVPVIEVSNTTEIREDEFGTISLTNKGDAIAISKLRLKWGGDFKKFSCDERKNALKEIGMISQFCDTVQPEDVFEKNQTIAINLQAFEPQSATELMLTLSIGNDEDPVAYVNPKEVVNWESYDMEGFAEDSDSEEADEETEIEEEIEGEEGEEEEEAAEDAEEDDDVF